MRRRWTLFNSLRGGDVDSRKPLATLEGHKDEVFSVAFSPDGKRLASASEDWEAIASSKTCEALLDGVPDYLDCFLSDPGPAGVGTPAGCGGGHFVEDRLGLAA